MTSRIVPRLSSASVFGVPAILFSLVMTDPALAGNCVYAGLASDNGPCVEVRNELGESRIGNTTMNVWCLSGQPTSTSHKIILRPDPADSFTCKGTQVRIQRVQAGCNTCDMESHCGNGKAVLELERIFVGNVKIGERIARRAC